MGRGRILGRRRILAALLAAPWVAWALARTLAIDTFHPAVALMSLTPLVAATAIVPLIVALATREWVVAAVAAVAMAALVVAVLPRALGGPQQASDGAAGRTLVVMSANLRLGQADPRAVLRLVREHDVDVLSLQELTPQALARLDAAGARTLLPGRVVDPRARASGTGLMARRGLRTVPEKPARGTLQAALPVRGAPALALVAVHPVPPISRDSERDWRAVLDALPGPYEGGRAHLLLGDFNATLDQRALRRVLDRGYADAADATGDGLVFTFAVGDQRPLITIDHVLVARTIGVRRFSAHDVAGSDHRAIVAELVLGPA